MAYPNNVRVAILILASLCAIFNVASAVDKTLEEGASGKDVVEAVVEKIRRANPPDDSQFLRRLAYVETKDGASITNPATNTGGIWNVNQYFYKQTKDASLSTQHSLIQSAFNIAWANTTWQDLLKPLYSGLAARLYIDSIGQTIPQKLTEQALFWAQHFNSRDSWTDQDFVNRTEEYENSTIPCDGKMDLLAIFDQSGSIGEENFEVCKAFLANFFGSFSLRQVRLGLVMFNTWAEAELELDNYLPIEEIQERILKLVYPGEGATNTNKALELAWEVFQRGEPRVSVPRIATIFTDGKSNPPGIDNIQLLKEGNVSTFAVGITNQIDQTELLGLAYNINKNVYSLNNFDVLNEFFKRLNDETCKTPQEPSLDEPIEDGLNQGQRRYYSLSVPEEGLTLGFRLKEGSVNGYWSRSERNPSSAIYDGQLEVSLGTFIASSVQSRADGDEDKVYVTVQGVGTYNNYTIEAISGNVASPRPTTPTTTTPSGVAPITFNVFSIVLTLMAALLYCI